MKASLTGNMKVGRSSTAGDVTLTVAASDLKLHAVKSGVLFANGLTLSGTLIALEKADRFIVDYKVPGKGLRFQFLDSAEVAKKRLNLTYAHSLRDNKTNVNATLVFDSANKVSVDHVLGSVNCKLRYSYVHKDVASFEPCYDLAKNSWDFAISGKVHGGDVLRASCQTSRKNLVLEWSRKLNRKGSLKISAAVDLANIKRIPKLSLNLAV